MSYKHKQLEWELRLFSRLIQVGECLEWQGLVHHTGYGRVIKHGRHLSPHKCVYEIVKGKVPKGKVLDHLCRNRKCANPDHLEVVTHRENILRGIGRAAINARRTHCIYGHELNKENSYSEPGKNKRRCRKCMARRTSQWKQK